MASSKAPLFDPLSFKQSFWSKALAHPARIIILRHLLDHGTTPFYDLARLVPLAKTTVSQHLRYLREAGLIECSENYPHSYYAIKREVCAELAQNIKAVNNSFIAPPEGDHPPALPATP